MSDATHRAPTGAPLRAARSPDTNRRRFLMFGVGAAGAAAAAPVLAAQGAVAETVDAAPQSQGYRETEHVRKFYATTRI